MELSCIREKFYKALTTISRIISIKPSLPILGNVLLKTEKGRLKLAATDLEIGINWWIGAKIEKEGEITVPVKILTDFIGNLTSEKINLSTKDLTLNIKNETNEANIKGVSSDEFPLIPQLKEEVFISLPFSDITKAIDQVVFATSLDESRPVLSGVLFKFEEDKLKLVATDAARLVEKTISLPSKVSATNLVVPKRALMELARIPRENLEEEIEIKINPNQIEFDFEDLYLISRLIEGEYPNYEQIIPQSAETKVLVNLDEFSRALKIASLFAKEAAGNVIKLQIKGGKKGEITIFTQASGIGDNTSKISAEVEGKDLEILFNAKYILDVLNVLDTNEVRLEFNGKLDPALIKPKDKEDFLYIIMPRRG